MNLQAIAETAGKLYEHCRGEMVLHYGSDVTESMTNIVFEQACHIYITNLINDKKQPRTGDQRQVPGRSRGPAPQRNRPKPLSDAICQSCGRQLTVGEKKYCDDNGAEYLCYQCSH